MNHGSYLDNWTNPLVHDKCQWWYSPLEDHLYRCNGNDWLLYVQQFGRQYHYSQLVASIPTTSVVQVSICIDVGSFSIENEALSFSVYPSSNSLSDFGDTAVWGSLSDGLDTTVDDPTILLDQYQLPSDGGLALVNGIVEGTACIVSGGSFNPDSSLGPAAVLLL